LGRAIKYLLAALAALALVSYPFISLFVVQPIGALPEGRTLIVSRSDKMQFIDSADAICAREMGGVSLLCRAGALAAVAENQRVIAKLPYSALLYRISTDGKTYDR
jgi:hypothetical protein